MGKIHTLKRAAIVGALLAGGAFMGGGTVAADDDEFQAYIYAGTCDDISGRAIDDIGGLERDEDELWRVVGDDDPIPGDLFGEDEDVDLTIEELTAEPHTIVVRAGDDDLHDDDDDDDDDDRRGGADHDDDLARAAVVACGEIEGELEDDGTLRIELDAVDDSGIVGRAHLAPDDDDDDETEVTVVVWTAEEGTPAASAS